MRSRDLNFLSNKLKDIDIKIRRLILGGSTKHSSNRNLMPILLKSGKRFNITQINTNYIDFGIFPIAGSAIRGKGAWGAYSLYDENGLDIIDIYEKLNVLNPDTLFVKEIEFIHNDIKLIFRDRRESDIRIRQVLEKSKNTKSCPLYLQNIHDKKTIYEIRKKYFKKLMPIAKVIISAENVLKYKIIEDNYENRTIL